MAGKEKKYTNAEAYFRDYPYTGTSNHGVRFNLKDGSKSPIFNDQDQAIKWFNNYKKTHPGYFLRTEDTSTGNTTKQTKQVKQTKPSTPKKSAEQLKKEKDAYYKSKWGYTEEEATRMQQPLVDAGFLDKADGKWGDDSRSAQKKFDEWKAQQHNTITNPVPDQDISATWGGEGYGKTGLDIIANKAKQYEDPSDSPYMQALRKAQNQNIFQNQTDIWMSTPGLQSNPYYQAMHSAQDDVGETMSWLIPGGAGWKFGGRGLRLLGKGAQKAFPYLMRFTPGNVVKGVGYYVPRAQATLNKIAPWVDAAWYSSWAADGINDIYEGVTDPNGVNYGQIGTGGMKLTGSIPSPYSSLWGSSFKYPWQATSQIVAPAQEAVQTSNDAQRALTVGNALFWPSYGVYAQDKLGDAIIVDNEGNMSVDVGKVADVASVPAAVYLIGRGVAAKNGDNWFTNRCFRSYDPPVNYEAFNANARPNEVYNGVTAGKWLRSNNIPINGKKIPKGANIPHDDAFNAYVKNEGGAESWWRKGLRYTGNVLDGVSLGHLLTWPTYRLYNWWNPGGKQVDDVNLGDSTNIEVLPVNGNITPPLMINTSGDTINNQDQEEISVDVQPADSSTSKSSSSKPKNDTTTFDPSTMIGK